MKVTIPITIRKYVPGTGVPSRLVSISDEKHQADFLGVEYTDGSVKVPRYDDGENFLVIILNNGDINLMKDGDVYKIEMSNFVYEKIKDDYDFIACQPSTGYDRGDELTVIWYDINLDNVHFVNQKDAYSLEDEVFMNTNNAIIFDDTPLTASIEKFDDKDLLCVTKNGRKFVLFNSEDEAMSCMKGNVQMFASDCNSYGVEGESYPSENYYAKYNFRIESCSVSEGVVNGRGRLNVTISGFEWNAFFDIKTTGGFDLPVSSLEFGEA
ncbi:MAG: hypothetical protein UHS32_11410 [Bacteroidaceae bacterium]|nr:hypothetical protein [Bacteroidaceae bacterium]